MMYIPDEGLSGVELIMRPGQPSISWKEFIGKAGSYSIAVDGYVHGKTRTLRRRKISNFDHHAHSNPITVRATCGQIYWVILNDFYEIYSDADGRPRAKIYANHNDPDVAMSYALIKHGYRREFLHNRWLHKLVTREDLIDSIAGANPFRDQVSRRLAWVFNPYSDFRSRGMPDKEQKDPDEWLQVIYDIEERIIGYINGNAGEIKLDLSYKTFCKHNQFIVANEIGAHAKTGIFQDGYKIYVLFRERPDGRYGYVIGMFSMMHSCLNLRVLAKQLNAIEVFVDEKKTDTWGGGNHVIGSGRLHGSAITPDVVANMVLKTLDRKK
jgi:hypothetical protein